MNLHFIYSRENMVKSEFNYSPMLNCRATVSQYNNHNLDSVFLARMLDPKWTSTCCDFHTTPDYVLKHVVSRVIVNHNDKFFKPIYTLKLYKHPISDNEMAELIRLNVDYIYKHCLDISSALLVFPAKEQDRDVCYFLAAGI